MCNNRFIFGRNYDVLSTLVTAAVKTIDWHLGKLQTNGRYFLATYKNLLSFDKVTISCIITGRRMIGTTSEHIGYRRNYLIHWNRTDFYKLGFIL